MGVSWDKLRASDKPASLFHVPIPDSGRQGQAGAGSSTQESFGVGDRSCGGRALVPVFYAAPKVSVGNPYWP